MKPERWNEVDEILQSVLERAPAERGAYLDEACAGDEQLRERVESVLASHEQAGSLMEEAAFEAAGVFAPDADGLKAGERVGHYEILGPLGAGGMGVVYGVVYAARDPRLGRRVALKLLPTFFSRDEDRLRRFEQEAQAASALSHPNILSIYDIGTHDGSPYVVSELLEGETLRDRLAGGALTQRKAVDYALQIARGLAAAQTRGIIHRDLKPENIFVTKDGRVKILDFGLAKLVEPVGGRDSQTDVPTRKFKTEPGMIMGTAPYMSPEQVRGQPTDHRTDIFSFGAVLYEMLSGRRAFHGDSTIETLNAILKEEPPELSEINASVSPALSRLTHHCLEKNPAERFHSASDLAFALESLTGGSSSTSQALVPVRARFIRRERVAWIAAGLLLLSTLTLFFFYFRRASTEAKVIRFSIAPPEKGVFELEDFPYPVAVSPDGRRLVLATRVEGRVQLWLRSLDSLNAQPLSGTKGGSAPFWSPDSRFIGFFAEGKLKKIDVLNGSVQIVCNAGVGPNNAAWSSEGVILFSISQSGLFRVAAAGGDPVLVRKPNSPQEVALFWPQFLPDSRHFFYTALITDGAIVMLGSLDADETRLVMKVNSRVLYAPPGYLLYVREGTLLAHPFDAKTLSLTGEPTPIAEHIKNFSPTGGAAFSVSENGVLAFQSGIVVSRLSLFNRAGKEIGSVGETSSFDSPRFSPDGQKVAVAIADLRTGANDIWIYDLTRGAATRFTFEKGTENRPVWSPDGRQIAFTADEKGQPPYVHLKGLNDAGTGEAIVEPSWVQAVFDWSKDGQLIYGDQPPETGEDLFLLRMTGERGKPVSFLRTRFNESDARFSPDGKWVAYSSDESGKTEIYVRLIARPGEKWQVSNAGGVNPVWNRDGHELFYISTDSQLMAVPVKTGDTFEAGTPVPLFPVVAHRKEYEVAQYDVAPDGQRFIVNSLTGAPALPINVVINWTSELKH
jgi:serine/threonine protein kinase/Tol biopolymer transport system component